MKTRKNRITSKQKQKQKLYVNKLQSSNSQSNIYKLNPKSDKTYATKSIKPYKTIQMITWIRQIEDSRQVHSKGQSLAN